MKRKIIGDILTDIEYDSEFTDQNITINQITYDSRKVVPGALFVAITGFTTDGHRYLKEAEKKGAVAAIVEHKETKLSIPQIVVKNSREILAKIAANFYSPEILKLKTVGITGTNGKTTTSYLVKSIMESAGISSGLIGTIAYEIKGELIPSWNTTPESVDLMDMMYSMYSKDQRGCVMEVSSHGLSLNRVDSINFEVAVFTNLSHDHLDFHQDVDSYFSAKRKLFDLLNPTGTAVINNNDPYGKKLIQTLSHNTISFGLDASANVYTNQWSSDLNGINLNVHTAWGNLELTSPLIGQFNVENVLAAISVGLAFNFDLQTIKAGIEQMKKVPGRLEPVKLKNKRIAIVDYSHTPDALQKALQELNKITRRELWLVFGCGGDRDRKKRPEMGKIAADYANHVIVTSDNPRTEKPDAIIQDILAGIPDSKNVTVEADRRKAIQKALENATTGDLVLVAGKGHETYQEINGIKHAFDDREIIRELDK